jgi:hypothetical protein
MQAAAPAAALCLQRAQQQQQNAKMAENQADASRGHCAPRRTAIRFLWSSFGFLEGKKVSFSLQSKKESGMGALIES